MYHANINQKMARGVILISDKIDLRTRAVIRGKRYL